MNSLKVLVIYYSFEGNTRLISQAIAEATGADLLELKLKNEEIPKGFMKYILGGKQVVLKQEPELLPIDKNPNDYDIIFLGTPVWAFTYTPALRAFFQASIFKGKKVALFCTHSGNKSKTFEEMRKALGGNEILGQIDFKDPLKADRNECIKKAKHWTEFLIKEITEVRSKRTNSNISEIKK